MMGREYEMEVFTVTKEQLSVEKVYCDICGKLIYKKNLRCDRTGPSRPQVEYLALTTGHHDWGNDSVESIDTFFLCSSACAKIKFDQYLKKCMGTPNSLYFEISHNRDYADEIGEAGNRVL